MHRVRSILLIMLTLALVAAGALLPWGTAIIQDRRLESANDTRELNDVQLLIQQDWNAAQILNFLGGEYTTMDWNSDTDLSSDEALSNAVEIAGILVYDGLLGSSDSEMVSYGPYFREIDNYSASAFLAISSGENREALLLWECTWESVTGDFYTVWIDDATGTMYAIQRQTCGEFLPDAELLESEVASEEQWETYISQWGYFLYGYYGASLTKEPISTREETGIGVLDTVLLTLEYTDETGAVAECTVRLTVQGDAISFMY